jgi:hypothetical protein
MADLQPWESPAGEVPRPAYQGLQAITSTLNPGLRSIVKLEPASLGGRQVIRLSTCMRALIKGQGAKTRLQTSRRSLRNISMPNPRLYTTVL